MHASLRSAGFALVASVSLASQALPAHASTAVHPSDAGVAARPAAVQVHVRTMKDGVTRSRNGFRPGNTVFTVRRGTSGGSVEVLRLRHGYTIRDFKKDAQGIFSGDPKLVRRVDRHVVFYGGAQARRGTVNKFGVHLGLGHYYLFNLDKGTYTSLHTRGPVQHRGLPHPTASISYAKGNSFAVGGRLQAHSWVRQVNHTDEPHFTDLNRIKKGTTRHQVKRWFHNGAKGQPRWALRYYREDLVLSPGRSLVWYVDARPGRYLEACWFPSDENGMPHALMGMWGLTRLH
jgi:hypothetical protein